MQVTEMLVEVFHLGRFVVPHVVVMKLYSAKLNTDIALPMARPNLWVGSFAPTLYRPDLLQRVGAIS